MIEEQKNLDRVYDATYNVRNMVHTWINHVGAPPGWWDKLQIAQDHLTEAVKMFEQLGGKQLPLEKSIRQLMIDNIKGYGWRDYSFTRGDNDAKTFDSYEAWLNSLSNSDLLWRYNDMMETISNLD